MKKYAIYLGVLIIGVFLGRLFFSNSSKKIADKPTTTVTNTKKQQWTCSMHPQIMRSKPGKCPICGMELIPVASGASHLSANQFEMTKNAMALANIETSTVGGDKMADGTVTLSGKITVNKDKTATQSAHFNGRIEKLYVKSLGEYVKMGQAVAEIYSPELVVAQQELIIAYKARKSQPKLYKAILDKFKNWKIHKSQLSEVERTGKVKTNFTIYAYVSGIVSEISEEEGSHIMTGHPIFKIENLNTVWANFDVYENQINLFKKGQAIAITAKAYPDKKYKGKVSFIDPILDTKTRIVKLRVVLNNKKGEFKPGMFIEGNIKGLNTANKQTSLVPATAVLWTGKRSVVYLKTSPDKPLFEMRVIQLGSKIGENYQVLSGLTTGDEVVTNGTFTVDAAAQLKGKESMMNQ